MHNRLRNKRRALNAAPVNSTMLPVRFVAKCVSIRRTLVAKEETAVASIAQLDGRPKTAVPNAPRAVRVRLVTVAKIALSGLLEKVLTKMPHNANNVIWVKQRQLKGQLLAVGVI